MIKVLVVCLGNICRSPTAHAILEDQVRVRALSERVFVDSAGTGDWHIGSRPDTRATAAAKDRGYDLSALRARQITQNDFLEFEYILAMDRQNLSDLQRLAPPGHQANIGLFLHYAPQLALEDVPDPYYGGSAGFEKVLDLVEAASAGFLDQLQARLNADA